MSQGVTAPPARWLVVAAFAAVYLIWGSTYLAILFAVETMPPLLMAGARHLVAGVLLYGLMRGVRREPAPSAKGWGRALVLGGGLLLVGNGGVTWAEQFVPSGLASLLVATVPMWMTVLGWLSGVGARPRGLTWLGIGLGLTGVALLAGGPVSGDVLIPGQAGLGTALLLVASGTWAATSLYARHHPPASSVLVGIAMQMLCGGVLLIGAGLVKGEGEALNLAAIGGRAWWAWGYLVAFGSLIGFVAYAWLLGVAEPALVGTYAFVNPVVAVGLGWAFAQERLTSSMAGGAALIVVAVALVVLGGRKRGKGGGATDDPPADAADDPRSRALVPPIET